MPVKNRRSFATGKIGWTVFSLILPLMIFLAWLYVTKAALGPALLLPEPKSVLDEFVRQLTGGTIVDDVGISLKRVLKGYGLAVLFGGGLGVVMGMFVPTEHFFALTFTSIRQIPMMAWVPLLVMWFGIGEASKVAVIFMAAYFPILMNTSSGIRRTDPKLIEVGRMYRLTPWKMFLKIYLPSALPSIFVGLKLALGISWMAVVGAEMIAASSGIGFRLNDARSLMQFPIVFCGMFAIAIAGVLMDRILTLISGAAAPWERKR
jgi:sulfonate transport system permease protein